MRPLRVTLLAVVVLCFSAWNLIRMAATLTSWETLTSYGAPAPYLASSSLAWGLAGAVTAFGLWAGHPLARRAGIALCGFYFAWNWLERLFIQPAPLSNHLFHLAISLCWLGLCLVILFSHRAREFFKPEYHN